jgi:hypothetical protein
VKCQYSALGDEGSSFFFLLIGLALVVLQVRLVLVAGLCWSA